VRTSILAAVLAAAFLLPSGRAGTAVRLEIEGLVEHAELVFEGRVVSAQSYQTPDGRVETEYFVSVHRSFVGRPFGSQVFRMPGGVLPDGSGMVVPGLPQVRPGADAIFFLSEVGTSGWRMPVGLAQGVLDVVVTPGGARALARSGATLSLLDPVTGALGAHVQGALLDYQETVRRIEAAAALQPRGR